MFKRPLGIANGSFQNDREPVNKPGGQSLEASCILGSVEQAAFLCVCVFVLKGEEAEGVLAGSPGRVIAALLLPC